MSAKNLERSILAKINNYNNEFMDKVGGKLQAKYHNLIFTDCHSRSSKVYKKHSEVSRKTWISWGGGDRRGYKWSVKEEEAKTWTPNFPILAPILPILAYKIYRHLLFESAKAKFK